MLTPAVTAIPQDLDADTNIPDKTDDALVKVIALLAETNNPFRTDESLSNAATLEATVNIPMDTDADSE